MTLIFMDSFDDNLHDLGKWDAWQGVLVAGRHGNAARLQGGQTTRKTVDAADEHATFVMGFAFRYSFTAMAASWIARLLSDAAATIHLGLYINASGKLLAYRGDGVAILGTSEKNLTLNNWYYIEWKGTLSDTAGAVEVRVNGETWINVANVDTKNAGTKTVFDSFQILNTVGNTLYKFDYDDLYLCNGAGTIRNNFLGECAIESRLPNGNGFHAGFVGSDGNSVDNHLLVDEATPDNADYVGAATDGTKDSYLFQDLAQATGNVLGVQVSMHSQKSDTGAKSIRGITRIGGVDYLGADRALDAAWVPRWQRWEQSPATAADWTIAEVNGAEFGVEARP